MTFANPYWSDVLKAGSLQRWIIVHSILYYEMNTSIVSDKQFDSNSKQLVELMETLSKEEKKRTEYWYCMNNFDGSTGFDLYDKLSEDDKEKLKLIAEYLYRQSTKSN